MTAMRRGRRVALLARYPEHDPAMPQRIPNLGIRMIEAALRASDLPDLEVRVWDLEPTGPFAETIAAQVIAFDPDVVGFSMFLWSMPFFLEVAAAVKADDPGRLVVFGGPSARPVMVDLPPHDKQASAADLLVINEGEDTIREIVASQDRSPDALCGISGVAVRQDGIWRETPARPLGDLNLLASPYEMGLMPRHNMGILQTYRGCPFSCSFCEWGTLESPKRVREVDNLAIEFDSMSQAGVQISLLADAGLNLNNGAFNNIRQAADRTGFLEQRGLICEVYPATVRPDHLAFLRSVRQPYVGVGLQSFDPTVLAQVDRKYDEARFEQTLSSLGEVSRVAVEVIMGLPGDHPEKFRRNFERARRLPTALRVYHCVVLPSGLMTRSPPEHQLDYDPVTLKMQSCLGWTEAALADEVAFLDREAARVGGQSGSFFWVFPPP